MTAQAPRKEEVLCHFPDCEGPVDPETGALAMCQEHAVAMDAAADVEAWGFALNILKPWVESARAIGHPELTKAMERVLVETETALELARDELKKAEATLES